MSLETRLSNAARRLLRDPHSFTSKLSSTKPFTVDQANALAPYLLPTAPYRRVREKEVNDCYEAFSGWLQAFYLYSVVSDEIQSVCQKLGSELQREAALEKDAKALQRGLSNTGQPCRAPLQSYRGAAMSSPTNRRRSALGEKVAPAAGPRPSGSPVAAAPGASRPRASQAPDPSEGASSSSRAPSPAQPLRLLYGSVLSGLGRRPVPSVAFGSRTARPTRVSQRQSAGTSAQVSPLGFLEGLQRVQSERTLGRSSPGPGTARTWSRSPSPGASAAPRITRSETSARRRRQSLRLSPSEGSLAFGQRMVGAPSSSCCSLAGAQRPVTASQGPSRLSPPPSGRAADLGRRPEVHRSRGVAASPREGKSQVQDSCHRIIGIPEAEPKQPGEGDESEEELSPRLYQELVRSCQMVINKFQAPMPMPPESVSRVAVPQVAPAASPAAWAYLGSGSALPTQQAIWLQGGYPVATFCLAPKGSS